MLENERPKARTIIAVIDRLKSGRSIADFPRKIIMENNKVEKKICAKEVPHTSDVAKSLSLSFNPIEKSKRVTPKSAIVCRPSGVSKPAKLYANPASKKPTIGGRPILLINSPKKNAKVTSVIIIFLFHLKHSITLYDDYTISNIGKRTLKKR